MTSLKLDVPTELLDKFRALNRGPHDPEKDPELLAAVDELLALAPDDPTYEKEYAFCVTLRGVARTRAASTTDALRALADFQDVDCVVTYETVTITEASFVPENVTLFEIDGKELNGR